MSNKNKNTEDEWRRVMANPENVIISESLIARVDPYNLGDIANPVSIKPKCTFTFEGYTMTGEVISFSNVAGQRSYTFSSSLKEASNLMNTANLLKFQMSIDDDEILSMAKEHITDLNFNVDVQSASSALVTITFSEVTQ